MANYSRQLKEDIQNLWGGLGFLQKLIVFVLMICLVTAITYIITKSGEPDWAVLYSDLSDSDVAAVTRNLKEAGWPYKLSDDGKTVFVVRDKIDELRLSMAEDEVIKDGYGLGDLEKIPLGTSKEMRNFYWLRMIQGELTRTIKTMKGIKNVRVSIALPERSVFSNDDEEPKASVTLILEPGYKIDSDKVKGIKNLVAHAVARLSPENVFITDHLGQSLSDDEQGASSVSMMDLKTKTEIELARKVKNVLEKIAGKNNVEVEATVAMNFDKVESQYNRVIPINSSEGDAKGILISSQVNTEKYNGKNAQGSGGVPGTTSNIPSFQGSTPAAVDKSSEYIKENTTNNYEFSKEERSVKFAQGTIEKITLAVAINKILTSAEKNEIRNLAISASGIEIERGDIITLTGMPFSEDRNKNAQTEILEEINSKANWDIWVKDIAPTAVILILGLTTLFMFYSLIKKPLTAQEIDEEDEDLNFDQEFDMPESPELLEAATIPLVDAKLDPEIERMRGEISGFISSNPEEASRILLGYMKD